MRNCVAGVLMATAIVPSLTYAGCENPASTCYVNEMKKTLEVEISGIPKGDRGAAGVAGPQGVIGPQGAAGAIGPQGAVGATGPQGAIGDIGLQGVVGSQGAIGPQGATGAMGSQGVTGSQGAIGPQGVAGATGSQGLQGVIGATGPQGEAGAIGPQGAMGSQGVAGAIGTQGAAGPQGAAGAIGSQGAIGPQGAAGAIGTQGAAGPQGAAGAIGSQGAIGPQGAAGALGFQGAAGPQGAAGTLGFQGATGPQGVGGAIGSQGAIGPQGANGAQGPTGPGTAYSVCQQALGGVVIWVESSGTHGLIAASVDQADNKWTNIPLLSLIVTSASGNGIRAGHANTALIISREAVVLGTSPLTDTAAIECLGYSVKADGVTACAAPGTAGDTCYGDWYLPSQYELNQLYLRGPSQGACAGLTFAAGNYWSSTESASNAIFQAYSQNLTTGVQQSEGKTSSDNVRCMRSF